MLYAIVKLTFKGGLNKYYHDLAFAIDQLGNVMIAPMANDVLIKKMLQSYTVIPMKL